MLNWPRSVISYKSRTGLVAAGAVALCATFSFWVEHCDEACAVRIEGRGAAQPFFESASGENWMNTPLPNCATAGSQSGFCPSSAPRADERTLVRYHANVSAAPLRAPIRMGARMDGGASRRSEA